VADQGLFGGGNFLISVLLARWLEPAAYGAFAVAYSIFLFLASLCSALLTEPMMAFGPGKYAPSFPEYFRVLVYAVVVIVFRRPLVALLLGRGYLAHADLLLIWLLGPLILALGRGGDDCGGGSATMVGREKGEAMVSLNRKFCQELGRPDEPGLVRRAS